MKHISLALGVLLMMGCSSCHELNQILETGTSTETVSESSTGASDLDRYRVNGHELSSHGIVYEDVPYGSDSKNDYDLILPNNRAAGTLIPVVIYFHGGGFVQGNKNSLYKKPALIKEMTALLQSGYALANANYRLLETGEKEGVIKCLKDAKYLVQKMKNESPKNGINPNKIILSGSSAGASMALWLALNDDMADKESSNPVLRESTRVAGVVAENAQSTLDLVRWEDVFKEYNWKYNEGLDEEMKARLYGMYGLSAPSGNVDRSAFENATSDYRHKVDFASFMDAGDPPLFIANKPNLDGPPTEKNLIFHHREHAHYLEMQSAKVGGNFDAGNEFYYLTNPKSKDVLDFVDRVFK